MTDKKITDFSAAAALDGTEKIEIVQFAVNVRTTAQAIANLATVGAMAVTTQTGTTYTLVIGDASSVVNFSNGSAITLTVPTNASVAFPIGTTINLRQTGAGVVTVTAAGGVTLQSVSSHVATNGQYAVAAITKVATNTWALYGNLA